MLFFRSRKKAGKKRSDVKRNGVDRRSNTDGRRMFETNLFPMDPDRRSGEDRRSHPEQRNGWKRVSEWSSRSNENKETCH
jgi:hypothetical protein